MSNLITLLNLLLSILLVLLSIYVYKKINELSSYDEENQSQLYNLVKDLNYNSNELKDNIEENIRDIDELENTTSAIQDDLAELQTS
jgi:cell shape-determining protein MreC